MEWSTLIGLATGSILAVVAVLKAFNEISARLDARKQRIRDDRLKEIADVVELKQLKAETDKETHELLVEHLWQVIEKQKEEIAQLESDGKLTRPVIKQLYAKIRLMRNEIEQLKLTPDEARALKTLLDETEELLP